MFARVPGKQLGDYRARFVGSALKSRLIASGTADLVPARSGPTEVGHTAAARKRSSRGSWRGHLTDTCSYDLLVAKQSPG